MCKRWDPCKVRPIPTVVLSKKNEILIHLNSGAPSKYAFCFNIINFKCYSQWELILKTKTLSDIYIMKMCVQIIAHILDSIVNTNLFSNRIRNKLLFGSEIPTFHSMERLHCLLVPHWHYQF